MSLRPNAQSSETVTYSYDALGRLVQTSHSGTANPGVVTSYSYDPADNRTNVTVTGASGMAGNVAPQDHEHAVLSQGDTHLAHASPTLPAAMSVVGEPEDRQP